jgi:hypothetical protein
LGFGQPVNPNQSYRLVINDFMAKAQFDLKVFGELQNKPAPITGFKNGYSDDSLANLIIRYVERTGSISQVTDGRISRIANWQPRPDEIAPCWEDETGGKEWEVENAA